MVKYKLSFHRTGRDAVFSHQKKQISNASGHSGHAAGTAWKDCVWSLRVSASVTIEYTLLLPVLLLVYFFLICVGLYQYNRCIFQENMRLIAVEALHTSADGEALINSLQAKESGLLVNKYLLAGQVHMEYKKTGRSLYAFGSMEQINPFSALGIGADSWTVESSIRVTPLKRQEFLRFMKSVTRWSQKEQEEAEQEELKKEEAG